ncbi:SpoIIE family protein phosphatase [Nonomuraea gerenzanensis]|uniref:Anti-sigma B factor RsbT / Phosphoserine phosphatase RsbX n=1 Tax=Nonomuraea gerenzanensis TaxID=93944 RepID=A0A1M4EM93_9ACTN|nr:SpoIIE family protein phosphatase [Nonomuraea gerenzanensis]UBU11460.1 SpoIIE family protein phosphatase [Nonomuraea gerenzanensis]SBO99944.1 Anti-sigma B factor RsbT / Phosphoserine phosphatase RsbX [Nonomuraea gerenzanensis]
MEQLIRSGHEMWIRVEEAGAIGAARRAATVLAGALGFAEVARERVAIAVSEAASNLVAHAVEGMMLIRPHLFPTEAGAEAAAVEVLVLDRGPGIADLGLALRDGYSTAGTLGVGLGGITRMTSAHDVYSVPGKGTVIWMCFTADDRPPPASRVSGLSRPIGEEHVCGDAFACFDTPRAAVVMMCDGLGHGEPAAEASRLAVRVFQSHGELPPVPLLERLHEALRASRGAAVAVARLDRASGRVRFAGVGNIAAWIVRPDGRQGLISLPGIAGQYSRTLREYEYVAPPHSMIVMHSDGLSGRWDIAAYPGLTARSPAVVATTLLRDAGTRRDDACVVALKVAS